MHCFLRAGEGQIGDDAHCMIDEFRSLGEILADAGYTCGLSGKWHLGGNLEPQEGFTSWITMPHGATSEFYDAQVIEDGKIRTEPTYLTDLWTERGVKFIEENKDRPFFLFLSYNGPYALGKSAAATKHGTATPPTTPTSNCPRSRAARCIPGCSTTRSTSDNPTSMRRLAAEVSGVDDGVGEIMETLERLGLDDNTLVIFTADQASAGGQHGLWGMGDHTRPLHAFDGTMHIPLICPSARRARPAGVRPTS